MVLFSPILLILKVYNKTSKKSNNSSKIFAEYAGFMLKLTQ